MVPWKSHIKIAPTARGIKLKEIGCDLQFNIACVALNSAVQCTCTTQDIIELLQFE